MEHNKVAGPIILLKIIKMLQKIDPKVTGHSCEKIAL